MNKTEKSKEINGNPVKINGHPMKINEIKCKSMINWYSMKIIEINEIRWNSLRILVSLCESLWILVNPGESLWVLANLCESLWIVVSPCESLWALVSHCESLWVLVGPCEFKSSPLPQTPYQPTAGLIGMMMMWISFHSASSWIS